MSFLASKYAVITQFLECIDWEVVIDYLGFLQADDIGGIGINQCLQLMQAKANTIDVERDKFHKRSRYSVVKHHTQ